MNTVCIVTLPDQAYPDIPRFLFHEPPAQPKQSLAEQTAAAVKAHHHALEPQGRRSRSHSEAASSVTIGGGGDLDHERVELLDELSQIDGWDEGEVPPKEYYRNVMEREFALANKLQKITLQTGVSATLQFAQRAALGKLEKEKRETMTHDFLKEQNQRTQKALQTNADTTAAAALMANNDTGDMLLPSDSTATFRLNATGTMQNSQSKRRKTTVTESEAAAGVVADRWANIHSAAINPVFTFGIPLDHTPQLSCWVDSFSVIRHECPVNTVITAKHPAGYSNELNETQQQQRRTTIAQVVEDDAGNEHIMKLGFSKASLEENENNNNNTSSISSSMTKVTTARRTPSTMEYRRPTTSRSGTYTVAKSLSLRRAMLDDVCHYGSLSSQLYSVIRQSVTERLWDTGELTFFIHGNGFECPIVNLLKPGGILDTLLADTVEESSKRQIAEIFSVELAVSASLVDSRSGNVVDLCPASIQGGQPLKHPTLVFNPDAPHQQTQQRQPTTTSSTQQVEKRYHYYSPIQFSHEEGQVTAGGPVSGFKTPTTNHRHQHHNSVQGGGGGLGESMTTPPSMSLGGGSKMSIIGGSSFSPSATPAAGQSPISDPLMSSIAGGKTTSPRRQQRRRGGGNQQRNNQSDAFSSTPTATFVTAPTRDPLANEALVNIDASGDHYCDLYTDKIRRQRRAFFAAERLRSSDMTSLLASIGSQWEFVTRGVDDETPLSTSPPSTGEQAPLPPPPQSTTSRNMSRQPSSLSAATTRANSYGTSSVVGRTPSTSITTAPTTQQHHNAAGKSPTVLSQFLNIGTTKKSSRSGKHEKAVERPTSATSSRQPHAHLPQRDSSALNISITLTKKCSIMPRQTATVRFILIRDEPDVVHKLLTTAISGVPLSHTAGDFCRTLGHILPLRAHAEDLPKKMVFINIAPIEKLPQSMRLLAAAKGMSDGPHTHLDHATPDVIEAVATFKEDRQIFTRACETLEQDNTMFQGKLKGLLRRIKNIEGQIKAKTLRSARKNHQNNSRSAGGSGVFSSEENDGAATELLGNSLRSSGGQAATASPTPSVGGTSSFPGGGSRKSGGGGGGRRQSRGSAAFTDFQLGLDVSQETSAAFETASACSNYSQMRHNNCTLLINNEEYTFQEEPVATEAAIVLEEIEELQLKIEALERDGGETLRKATRDNTNLVEEREALREQNSSLRAQKISLRQENEELDVSNTLAIKRLREQVLEELQRNAELLGVDQLTLRNLIEETSLQAMTQVGLIPPATAAANNDDKDDINNNSRGGRRTTGGGLHSTNMRHHYFLNSSSSSSNNKKQNDSDGRMNAASTDLVSSGMKERLMGTSLLSTLTSKKEINQQNTTTTTNKSRITLGPLKRSSGAERVRRNKLGKANNKDDGEIKIQKTAEEEGKGGGKAIDINLSVSSPWAESAPIRVPFTTLPATACATNTPDSQTLQLLPAAPVTTSSVKHNVYNPVESEESQKLRESMKEYLELSRDLHLKCATADQKRSVAVVEATTVQNFANALRTVLHQYTSTIASPKGTHMYPQLNRLIARSLVKDALKSRIEDVPTTIKNALKQVDSNNINAAAAASGGGSFGSMIGRGSNMLLTDSNNLELSS